MLKKGILFLDVDTQFDFLQPQGRLYVSEANEIIPNISKIRRLALDNSFSILASMDWHSLGDVEISDSPDFNKTFPPHCMEFQDGSERIGYLGEIPIDHVTVTREYPAELKRKVTKDQFHLEIRTNNIDIFNNPNTITLLEILGPKKIIVFGVALDFCVKCAIVGLIEWNKSEIILIKDAVKAIDAVNEEQILNNFASQNVRIIQLSDLKKEL